MNKFADYTYEKDTIPINVIKIKHPDSVTIHLNEHPFINGVMASGKTEEEAKLNARKMLHVMLNFHHANAKKLRRRALWEGYWSKGQIWFTVVGIGLIIYIRPKGYKRIKGLHAPKGLWFFNKIRITLINYWKKTKK